MKKLLFIMLIIAALSSWVHVGRGKNKQSMG